MAKSEKEKSVKASDIAREAGVSRSAVYSLLSNQVYGENGRSYGTGLAEATRNRIYDACRRLNYQPENRELLLRLYPERGGYAFMVERAINSSMSNPYFSRFFSGALDAMVERDSAILFAHFSQGVDYVENPDHLPKPVLAYGVNKVMIAGKVSYSLILALRKLRVAVVQVSRRAEVEDVPSLVPDFKAAGALAIRHLIEMGHRRIGIAAGWHIEPMAFNGKLLLSGVCEEASRRGLTLDADDAVSARKENLRDEEAFAREVLERGGRRTAICCLDDATAETVYRGLKKMGLRIPEDVSMTGVNDDICPGLEGLPLTTVHLPIEELGNEAIEVLDRLAHDGVEAAEIVQTHRPVHLVERASVRSLHPHESAESGK